MNIAEHMRLWVDGGSLHATMRCLDQTGTPKDAADQLHIATQLAFADRLVIGSYGGGEYLKQTEEVKGVLSALGFEQDCIEVVHAHQGDLERIYAKAADTLARRLENIVGAFDYGDSYPGLSSERRSMEDKFDAALRRDLSDSDRAALYDEIRLAENNGLLIMLTKSDAFWEAARQLVGDGRNWTPLHSARLATVCRIFIHQEYANSAGAVYAPGRDRGLALRKIPEYVWQYIHELPSKVTDGFKVGETGLPPVAAVLAQRAKGDPRGLMAETLRVRDMAKPLRQHVRRILKATAEGDAKANLRAHREMEQLTNDLKVHLSVNTASSIASALDIFNPNGFVFSLLSGNVVGSQKIVSVILSLLRSRRIAVLSEMAAEIKVVGIDSAALSALERGVSAKRPKSPDLTKTQHAHNGSA